MTITGNAPAVARSLAVGEIVSWVVFTNVGVWAMPLKVTVEVKRNPVPLIVRLSGAAPTVRELGVREEIEGTGLPPPAPVTVKSTALDATPPPGSGTLTPKEVDQLSRGWSVRKTTAQNIHFVKPPPITKLAPPPSRRRLMPASTRHRKAVEGASSNKTFTISFKSCGTAMVLTLR